jgi:hypothetical protein
MLYTLLGSAPSSWPGVQPSVRWAGNKKAIRGGGCRRGLSSPAKRRCHHLFPLPSSVGRVAVSSEPLRNIRRRPIRRRSIERWPSPRLVKSFPQCSLISARPPRRRLDRARRVRIARHGWPLPWPETKLGTQQVVQVLSWLSPPPPHVHWVSTAYHQMVVSRVGGRTKPVSTAFTPPSAIPKFGPCPRCVRVPCLLASWRHR